MSELSIFVDESGDKSTHARYFILTLVFHDQSESIAENISIYEQSLAAADIPNIPFHSEPLLNGHGSYEGLTLKHRKMIFVNQYPRWVNRGKIKRYQRKFKLKQVTGILRGL